MSDIEDRIAANELTASQVYTQMSQTIASQAAEKKELLMDYGLMKIRCDQLHDQLKTCEATLEIRDAAWLRLDSLLSTERQEVKDQAAEIARLKTELAYWTAS